MSEKPESQCYIAYSKAPDLLLASAKVRDSASERPRNMLYFSNMALVRILMCKKILI